MSGSFECRFLKKREKFEIFVGDYGVLGQMPGDDTSMVGLKRSQLRPIKYFLL